MTSLRKVFGGRLVLSVVFWACACEHDSVATFDDTRPLGSSSNGGMPGAAGSLATAGDAAAGGEDTSGAGASAEAGSSSTAAAGKGGSAGAGGRGGSSSAGTTSAGKPSTGGGGGQAGSASGGSGGTKEPEPEPVTVTTSDFADTYVVSCLSSNFGDAEELSVDYAYSCVYEALMNPSLADVPEGAVVSEATLTLHCINAGDVVTVSYVAEAWDEDTVRWSTRPEAGSDLAELTCQEMSDVSLDLTAAVKAWVSGERAANGLYLRTEGSDGTDFASSEYEDVALRPSLSVTYTLPAK